MTSQLVGDERVARSTALVFACAFCALVVSVLVVQRSTAALGVDADSLAIVEAGTLELSDDDKGETLIDVAGLAPGRPIERCLEVSYNGSVLPAMVSFTPTSDGPLAPYMNLHVEQGTGGTFGSCGGFESLAVVADGNLADLSGTTTDVGSVVESPSSISFRVVVELLDDGAAQGLHTTFALTWEAVPG